ncbi:MAG: hypothetical protein HY078_03300 [Elusimicrobia bacterium]|nr:hypothetical protein [Elusimicrobiota bacterium]
MKRTSAAAAVSFFCCALLGGAPAHARTVGITVETIVGEVSDIRAQMPSVVGRRPPEGSASLPPIVSVSRDDAAPQNDFLWAMGGKRTFKYAHVIRRVDGVPEAISLLNRLRPFFGSGIIDAEPQLLQAAGRSSVFITVGPLFSSSASEAAAAFERTNKIILSNLMAITDETAREGAALVLQGQMLPAADFFK